MSCRWLSELVAAGVAQDMGMRLYAEVSDKFDAGLDRAIGVGPVKLSNTAQMKRAMK